MKTPKEGDWWDRAQCRYWESVWESAAEKLRSEQTDWQRPEDADSNAYRWRRQAEQLEREDAIAGAGDPYVIGEHHLRASVAHTQAVQFHREMAKRDARPDDGERSLRLTDRALRLSLTARLASGGYEGGLPARSQELNEALAKTAWEPITENHGLAADLHELIAAEHGW